jgi:hypothetical protein
MDDSILTPGGERLRQFAHDDNPNPRLAQAQHGSDYNRKDFLKIGLTGLVGAAFGGAALPKRALAAEVVGFEAESMTPLHAEVDVVSDASASGGAAMRYTTLAVLRRTFPSRRVHLRLWYGRRVIGTGRNGRLCLYA